MHDTDTINPLDSDGQDLELAFSLGKMYLDIIEPIHTLETQVDHKVLSNNVAPNIN